MIITRKIEKNREFKRNMMIMLVFKQSYIVN
jgi:hypothetical protein